MDLKAEVGAKTRQIEKCKLDNQLWKTRADDLLTKYNQIDPIEHENLKKKLKSIEESTEKKDLVVKNLHVSVQKLKSELETKERDLNTTLQKLDLNTKELQEKTKLVQELLQDPKKNQEVAVLTERLEKIRNSSRETAARDKTRRAELKDQINVLLTQNAELKTELTKKSSELEDLKQKLVLANNLSNELKAVNSQASVPKPVDSKAVPDTPQVPAVAQAKKDVPKPNGLPIVRPPTSVAAMSSASKPTDPVVIIPKPTETVVTIPKPADPVVIIPNPFSTPSTPASTGFQFTPSSTGAPIVSTFPSGSTIKSPFKTTPFNFTATSIPPQPIFAPANIPTNTETAVDESIDTVSPSESLKRERDSTIIDPSVKRAKVEELEADIATIEESIIEPGSAEDEEIESDEDYEDIEDFSDGEL